MMLSELIARGAAALEASDAPRLEAELLLAHLIGKDRSWLYAHGNDTIDRPELVQDFLGLVERRREGEPLAYIMGTREFWSLPLTVSPRVLIPRPDTETLVAAALENMPPDAALELAELGTGSGAIVLALASERPGCRFTATDICPESLDVARHNAWRLGLDQAIEFLQGSWFEPLRGRRFDLIVSNPPYIAENDPHLEKLGHEPRQALVAGPKGLDDLACIIGGALEHLLRGGMLLVEHGADQGESVRTLFVSAGFGEVRTLDDLAGRARVTLGRRVEAFP